MDRKMPALIEKIGFDFSWSEEKVWALDLPVEEMAVADLEWHLDVPFLWTDGGYYDLKPIEVMENPETHEKEFRRTMDADLEYPLDIMFWKGRWLFLDGLHRLMKAKLLGHTKVKVRKVPPSAIPLIRK